MDHPVRTLLRELLVEPFLRLVRLPLGEEASSHPKQERFEEAGVKHAAGSAVQGGTVFLGKRQGLECYGKAGSHDNREVICSDYRA